jgi:hypothetical protein
MTKRTRFTEKSLKSSVEEINGLLKEDGSKIYFRVNPRNGYTAVDEYVEGEGTSCRLVGGGTPKEVNEWTWQRYHQICRDMELERLQTENAKLKAQLKS